MHKQKSSLYGRTELEVIKGILCNGKFLALGQDKKKDKSPFIVKTYAVIKGK